ncbi:hypothetical protein BXU06_00535 [Aquaspirillum sp. LM1]|nr:hypothetical protein BXU06_00535 [Aquaspirillum sp. LM1]
MLKHAERLMMWQCSNGVVFWDFIGLNYNIFLLILPLTGWEKNIKKINNVINQVFDKLFL